MSSRTKSTLAALAALPSSVLATFLTAQSAAFSRASSMALPMISLPSVDDHVPTPSR